MKAPQLPNGLTPELIAQFQQYFQSLPKPRPKKVRGVLRPDQIRGAINAPYEYQEYPKMLWPPAQVVSSVAEEKQFREEHGLKLRQEKMVTQKRQLGYPTYDQEYWSLQKYPKTMQPKQVKVWNEQEEEAVLAAWRMAMPEGSAQQYPRWMFHHELEPKMVGSLEEEQALSSEWKPTIAAAFAAALDAVEQRSAPSPSRKGKRPSGEALEAA